MMVYKYTVIFEPIEEGGFDFHSKDLPERTLRRIIKQTGLSDGEFTRLL